MNDMEIQIKGIIVAAIIMIIVVSVLYVIFLKIADYIVNGLMLRSLIKIPYGDVDLGRIVVCAANRFGDDIILGPRHWDLQMHSALNLRSSKDWQTCEQGFIDQRGVYMTRKQAWVVAVKANQIRRLVGGQTHADLQSTETKLYSENLY